MLVVVAGVDVVVVLLCCWSVIGIVVLSRAGRRIACRSERIFVWFVLDEAKTRRRETREESKETREQQSHGGRNGDKEAREEAAGGQRETTAGGGGSREGARREERVLDSPPNGLANCTPRRRFDVSSRVPDLSAPFLDVMKHNKRTSLTKRV